MNSDLEWKSVQGWSNYEVSNTGLVRAIKGRQGVFPRLMTLTIKSGDGYSRVRLTQMPMRTVALVHRLVAFAFIPNPNNYKCVNHIDFDVTNNNVSNLEWCTQAHNIMHSRKAGRYADNYWKGKRSPSATLSDETVASIRSDYQNGLGSYNHLAKKYDSNKKTILRIINGVSYV